MSIDPKFVARLLASAVMLPVPGVAWAQNDPSQDVQLEEIVVTAEKRRENIQDAPVAVSAITATTIE